MVGPSIRVPLPCGHDQRAFEHGCGTGYVSTWLARRGARPVGIDLSEKQLANAARLQREFNVRLSLVQASA